MTSPPNRLEARLPTDRLPDVWSGASAMGRLPPSIPRSRGDLIPWSADATGDWLVDRTSVVVCGGGRGSRSVSKTRLSPTWAGLFSTFVARSSCVASAFRFALHVLAANTSPTTSTMAIATRNATRAAVSLLPAAWWFTDTIPSTMGGLCSACLLDSCGCSMFVSQRSVLVIPDTVVPSIAGTPVLS